MRFVYAVVMLSFSVIAFYQASRIFFNNTYKKATWCLFTLLSIASGIWSLGYGMMFMTENDQVFSIFRIVGLSGIILMMIAGQLIIGILSGKTKASNIYIIVEAIIGIVILTVLSNPATYTISHTPNGIVTTFTSSTVSLLYTGYVVAIATVFVAITVGLVGKKHHYRTRVTGKALLTLESLIGIGMIFDTILPAVGINFNIPASTILQYFGLEVCKRAVLVYNANTIDMENMSNYIKDVVKTPILVFNDKNVLQIANTEAVKFFGLVEEDIIGDRNGQFWQIFFAKDDVNFTFDGAESIVLDEHDTMKNRDCRLIIDPIYDSYKDNLGYIISVIDRTKEITYLNEIREAKEMAEKARNEAEEAKFEAERANNAKTQFLANMSHEMRTPMNAIVGFSDMALLKEKDMNLSKEALEYFQDINISSKGLLSLINSILDISKIESGKMEIINSVYSTKEIFDEISKSIGMLAENKGLKMEVSVSDDFPKYLHGDMEKIREILFNLTSNALKHTENGQISLNASVVSTVGDNCRIKFEVKDTGSGIKEEDIDKIFERFQQVDLGYNRKTEGSGLGLSIVKGYVDLMGGTISVDSVYGQGSVFTVDIPQKIEEQQQKTDDNRSLEHAKQKILLKNLKVLAVDDLKVNLKVVEHLCKMYGVSCDVVMSGAEALEKIKDNEYDIVFMDQMMPVMDGIEAMKRMREYGNGYEAGGNRKIIALTANTISGVKEDMLKEGFDGFLGKPINFGELEEVLIGYIDENQVEE